LFPHQRVTVRLLAVDHGLMNLLAAPLGVCRCVVAQGGMAGGALVVLGAVLLALALLFSDSVATLFRLFPLPVLGVVLFVGGMELAGLHQR
jgi:hypothetical protein